MQHLISQIGKFATRRIKHVNLDLFNISIIMEGDAVSFKIISIRLLHLNNFLVISR